jgi:hypothetical protein
VEANFAYKRAKARFQVVKVVNKFSKNFQISLFLFKNKENHSNGFSFLSPLFGFKIE